MNYARHSIFCDYSSTNIQKYIFVNIIVLCVYSIQKLLKRTSPNNNFKQFRFMRLEMLQ